jgi:hypothetical protein
MQNYADELGSGVPFKPDEQVSQKHHLFYFDPVSYSLSLFAAGRVADLFSSCPAPALDEMLPAEVAAYTVFPFSVFLSSMNSPSQ